MTQTRTRSGPLLVAAVFTACVAGIVPFAASARTAAVPQNTAAPSVSGQVRESSTLTTTNGTWSNAPTSFAYQWQRCADNGSGCTSIAGATSKAYTLTSADVDHTVRVVVTATNADGSSSANSSPSVLISSKDGPTNTAKPAVTGKTLVGEQLTASTGTWTGGVRSYSFQWQRCAAATLDCVTIPGATGRSYGVATADVGGRLRIAVTARNASGPTTAFSDATAAVTAVPAQTTTAVVTTTLPANKPPQIAFLSLRRLGNRVWARFRVCDDRPGKLTIVEHDTKALRLGYTRHFATTVSHCATAKRNWVLIPRFRGHGRFVVTLRARDHSGQMSRLVSRSLIIA